MLTPVLGTRFRRDVKRLEKRGRDLSKLRSLIAMLVSGDPLPARFLDHPLSGDWKQHRDCHIEPDWLLLYKIDGNELYLIRTGSHADLF